MTATAPRIIRGTDRPLTLEVALSRDEGRALLDLSERLGMSPAQVLRQALRVYQASLAPPEPVDNPFRCPRRASP